MLKNTKSITQSIIIHILSIILISGCIAKSPPPESKDIASKILNTTVSISYGPDGRLWRLIPNKHAVYVDSSNDNGKTFSNPIRINKKNQRISVWAENPPAIEISHSGRINVLYYADEEQKSTSFFSYSDDHGQSFSTPVLVSDHAQTAMHYMDKMLIDKDDNLHLFWHDTRHESHDKETGSGILSIYYSNKSPLDNSKFSNQFISDGICSCCRTATTFAANGKPVILARMVFKSGIRDHALIYMNDDNSWQKPQRVTHDNWGVEACPEHGPALAIDNNNRTHLTWFTLGDIRQGIFYAHTDDSGKTTSPPITLGNLDQRPSHPDIITLEQRVVIVWKEFDGEQSSLHIKESNDRGESWTDDLSVLSSRSKNGHPKLITNKTDIFLSWSTQDQGHQVIKLLPDPLRNQ